MEIDAGVKDRVAVLARKAALYREIEVIAREQLGDQALACSARESSVAYERAVRALRGEGRVEYASVD